MNEPRLTSAISNLLRRAIKVPKGQTSEISTNSRLQKSEQLELLKQGCLLESFLLNDEQGAVLHKRFKQTLCAKGYTSPLEQLYPALNKYYNELPAMVRQKFPQLTHSEFVTCCLALASFSNQQIASLMQLSASAVLSKKTAIRRKLDMAPQSKISEACLKSRL